MGGRVRPEALAALTQVPEVAAQTREVANAIRRDARRLAPRRTGELRRSIRVRRVYDRESRRVSYRVVVGAFYGRFVELGTPHAPARPFLRPAADMHGGVAPSDLSAAE